jgi:hypothetical protein
MPDMEQEKTITMPRFLTNEMLLAVKNHETTSTDNKEEAYKKIGWLICAWEVLVIHRGQLKLMAPNAQVEGRAACSESQSSAELSGTGEKR